MESQFERSFKAKLDSFASGLGSDPGGVESLDDSTAEQVLTFLLDSVTKSQSTEANTLATHYLLGLPRAWTLKRCERILDDVDRMNDEYEFRRLLDLFARLEAASITNPKTTDRESLLDRLVSVGLASDDDDIREDAEQFREQEPMPTPPRPVPLPWSEELRLNVRPTLSRVQVQQTEIR